MDGAQAYGICAEIKVRGKQCKATILMDVHGVCVDKHILLVHIH